MANIDAPSGLKPVRYLNGAAYDGKHNLYLVPSGDGTALFVGDAVKPTTSGGAAGVKVAGIECDGMPTCIQAAAGDTNVCGVVVGFLPDPTSLGTSHRLASTNRIAMVCDAPDVIFEIQEDSDGGAMGVNAAGSNADIVVGAGNATTGRSAMELDSSTLDSGGAGGVATLRILRPVPRPDNDPASANAKWEVLFVEHFYKTTTGI